MVCVRTSEMKMLRGACGKKASTRDAQEGKIKERRKHQLNLGYVLLSGETRFVCCLTERPNIEVCLCSGCILNI